MDANGAGVTCRHNNNTGTYVSTRFTYPDSAVIDPTLYNKVVNDGTCGGIASTVAIPRHYYSIASVQFCNSVNGTANAQWKGFGVAGTCQTKNDLNTTNNVKYGKFTRTGLVNDGRTFPYTDPFSGVSGTRTYAEEMTNYANWYAYYRTRILAAKTTTAIAFNIVDNKYRAGFHVMNAVATNWLDTGDFVSGSGLQRENWYNKLFAVPITAGNKTPTLDALIRIGQLVENGAGAVAGLPAHTDPIPTINSNPVTCTNNYHILFTDGFTDQIALPTVVGEVDGANVPARVVNGTLPPDPGVTAPSRSLSGLNALVGSPWPRPFRDVAVPTANSLADISLYYWMRDLRPALLNDVPSHDGRSNKDLDWRKDPAWWQHVNFSALSYGADGLLDANNRTAVENAIAAGTKNWFTAPNYPAPPNNSPFPATNKRATTADDLWHATVNARGKFAFAQTPIEVAYGLGSIISGIGNNPKARVGATFASRKLCTYNALNPAACPVTNNFIYEATIEPGWSGELKKVTVDTLTAVQGATRWSAGGKLDTLLMTPAAGTSPVLDSDNAWFLNRRIVTRNVDAGSFTVVPFRYADLTTGTNTQLNTLAATATNQQKVISYLRGGSTFGAGPTPQVIEGTAIGQFRDRTGKLGNISDSKPVVVGPANKTFTDANDYGYPAYKTTQASRALRVYVGANDGMFHVFNGEDDTGANTGGSEVYAYIPSGVFTNAFDEGGQARKGIRALTFQDGGAPIFKHHFYVNAPPKSADIDFTNCGTSNSCAPDWRTIVVSGLGKGGNTYFAIDATNTAVADEAQAAAKILWEFALPNSQFSFGNPLIAKTRADGWVVIIASGYNNVAGGKGHLYVLDARTGALLRTLNTTAADGGTAANPSGLTKISGYVKDDSNQILEQIYGGDLNGKMWRWDVSDVDPTTWQAKTVLFATLTDPSNVPQPITTAPEIEIDINNGVDRFVFIGTGRLLDADDLTSPSPEQIQTMYAVRDGSLDTPRTDVPLDARAVTVAASGITGVGGAAPDGWKQDLPAGQRIVVDVVAEFNVVVYAGTVLQPDPCLTSLPAYIYARDYVSGESLVYSGGVAVASAYSAEGAVGIELIALEDPTKSFPTLAIGISKETDGSVFPIDVKPKTFGGGHRLSWRILGD
ncbi:MAG: PilC/PilY family type IV pilus protein [Betaproteobacteria bacterium]